MVTEICPASGHPCEIREVCLANRSTYEYMLKATSKIEDSFLGRVVGLVGRFRKDLQEMPHYVEKRKAEEGIKSTDEVLSRNCSGEDNCEVQEAFNSGELRAFPLAER